MNAKFEESILTSLRKITRAIDLYSHQLSRQYNLTAPQIGCLRFLAKEGAATPSKTAKAMHLSQATVTGILDRLETRQLLIRIRSKEDRRQVIVSLTEQGKQIVESAPSPLQEKFAKKLADLPEENQSVIDTILGQVVTMMEADNLEAAPVLQAGSIMDGPTKPA
ncbi:MAG: MarR family transcriptional regulator [Deltaproteobacteria bacterium]|nr:MarR family transcriptional regulator [Deltaproteobacteria bacterium]MBN2671282.1 MarR family transcriptional regulator [Deltaproteobacteria bacterium]